MDDEFEVKIEKPKKEAEPGVAWENLTLKANSKEFAKLMRENGLRNYSDVQANTKLVVALLQRMYRIDLAAVLAFAKQQEVE